jgi:phosphoglycerate dehydrogenase-like enzyme
MSKKIKVCSKKAYLNEDTLGLLRNRLDDNVEIITEIPENGCADFDIMINGSPTHEELAASENLRYVIMPWAGVSPHLRELMEDFPQISLHNSHHNAATTGEMAIALMMAAARSIPQVDQKMHQCDWSPRQQSDDINYVLYGRTALILGFGSIGQHVALTCQALGMNVIGIRRDPSKSMLPALDSKVYPPESLHDLLPKTDVLIITIPLTTESEGMIGQKEFDLMPKDSLLINVGRGPVVNQHALYQALTSGKLHAAGLDVWWNYPKSGQDIQQPADVPLHSLPNVIMSPHRGGAGGTGEAENLRADELARLINAVARGEDMPNRINLELGY